VTGGTVAALVPAAGRGERLGGGLPKALREIGGIPMLVHAVRSLLAAPSVGLVVVAAPAEHLERIRALLAAGGVDGVGCADGDGVGCADGDGVGCADGDGVGCADGDGVGCADGDGVGCAVVAGGPTRAQSVRRALAALPAGGDADVVLVHDAARPFVPASVVEAVVAAVRSGHDAVVPVLPLPDTVKRVAPDGRVLETVTREHLYGAQTPQGFRPGLLRAAHCDDQPTATDDAVLVERMGLPVWTVPGSEQAFKVTTPADLVRAEALLAGAAAERAGRPQQ